MKKHGLNKDIKWLKYIKSCLMKRSHDNIDLDSFEKLPDFNHANTITESATTTLERKDQVIQTKKAERFLMPFQRRQLNRLRSLSPPKPNLQLCTENYLVYS